MIWADRIREEIKECFAKEIAAGTELVIRDEKTLSGRVHVGSLRGIVIHGLIAQLLDEEGIKNTFAFELNDFDPMDGLPEQYARTHREHMGKPLFTVPCPDDESHENFPMVFGDELKAAVEPMQLPIEWTTLRPLYESGKFNDLIVTALENAPKIRRIYKEVSGGGKPDDWFPLQVTCENCGKVGTTQVTGWESSKGQVTYACKLKLVEWAEGCGHEGTIDPFDGRAKLPWKVEWAAKWKVYGVHIEGCGKDHSAAGGSRSIAARISEEVFEYPHPFDIPYEFLNIGGKKMSSSKGLGAAAKDIADLLPPHLLKLLMIRTVPNRPIDFDPEGKTIPNLFDEYDRLSDHYFKRHQESDPDFARTFRLTQLDPSKEPDDLWQMRFTVLSFVLQMPHLDLLEEAEKLKHGSVGGTALEIRSAGASLTANEQEALEERALYVKKWLDTFAPEEYQYTILKKPSSDLALDDEQRNALKKVVSVLADASLPWEGSAIHGRIHMVKDECGIAPKKLFTALYQIFLGRDSGPQVGWFLSTFPREEVLQRCAWIQHADYGHLLPAAHGLIEEHTDKTKAHLIATGAAMEALAEKFGGDPQTWKVAGMLHDLDWDQLDKDYEKHCGEPLENLLKTIAAPAELLADIRAHYQAKYGAEYPLDTMLRKCLYCVDELTGFIIAVTLVRPSKKIADVEVQSVKKKLKDKTFAAQVDRQQIKQCEELLPLPLDEFIEITLKAMKALAEDMGL